MRSTVRVHIFIVPVFREQPLYSFNAQVFRLQNDVTVTKWLPITNDACPILIVFDVTRQLHRLISVKGEKVSLDHLYTITYCTCWLGYYFGEGGRESVAYTETHLYVIDPIEYEANKRKLSDKAE